MRSYYNIRYSRAFFFILAVLLGSLIFFIRNPVNFILPTFYGEDGTWVSQFYNYGFIHVLEHARSDYYVFWNLAALWISIQWCHFFYSDTLYNLPKCVALISYFIYALSASLPIIFLKNYLKPIYLFLLWLALCFMPLGCYCSAGHEIIGRLSNIGFLFLYIGFLLILYRFNGARKLFEFLLVDFLLISCAFTNPICIIYIIPWFVSEFFYHKLKIYIILSSFFMMLPFSFVALKVMLHPQRKELVSSALSMQKIIEIGIVRSILYPIAYPFYSNFSIFSAIFLLGMMVFLILRFSDKKSVYIFLFGGSILSLVSLILLVLRPDLRNYAINFTLTYPDRYYYSQNMISITLIVFLIQNLLSIPIKTIIRTSLAFLFIAFLCSPLLLEFPAKSSSSEYQPIVEGFLFEDCLNRAIENQSYVDIDGKPNNQKKFIKVDIFPSGWSMVLPISKIKTN